MCWDERFPPFPETWRGRHVYVRAAYDDFQGKTSDHERPDLGTGFVYIGPRDDPHPGSRCSSCLPDGVEKHRPEWRWKDDRFTVVTPRKPRKP